MAKPKLLIFDLDDTIFETQSITDADMHPVFDAFYIEAKKYFDFDTLILIEKDLWRLPFDAVAEHYGFPIELSLAFAKAVNTTSFDFTINCFDDFHLVHLLLIEKVLVTTGFSKIQNSKINALRLRSYFSEIYIDDVLDAERIYKKGIFKNLLLEKSLSPNDVLVIGDNPKSELAAAIQLEIKTVQVAKLGQEKMSEADFVIDNYVQLVQLVNSL